MSRSLENLSPKESNEDDNVPLLLSSEFNGLFLAIFYVLLIVSFALLYLTLQFLFYWLESGDMGGLTETFVYLISGTAALFAALAIRATRKYFRRTHDSTMAAIREKEFSKIKESIAVFKSDEYSKIKEEDFEKIDEILQVRKEKAETDFDRNISDAFLITSLEMKGANFFGPCSWKLQPGVNILLGRNGFGKSFILRSIAALLQRNEEASNDLLAADSDKPFLELTVQRNGTSENIRRERHRFTQSMGKIPILAIPDSRFVSRMDTSLEVSKELDEEMDLRANGARHFLEDRPYGEMMKMLFNELCFDYLESRSFDKPLFDLLRKAIEELTGDRFRFHAVERVGRNAFRLLVITEGNDRPLPIQYISQGTLSVLGVVGIIRSYLASFFPKTGDSELLKVPAIVFIDELDAHLHPLWQQKLTSILRNNFPNIQFILSAHSPLVVAGCWNNEVTVLRKSDEGFVLQQLERDFIGTPVADIYELIFGVEDIDDSYLQSASRATSKFSNVQRISELENKTASTERERRELFRLVREENMIRRASEVLIERTDDQERIFELEAKIEALQDELGKFGKIS